MTMNVGGTVGSMDIEKAGHDLSRILNSNNEEFNSDQAGLQAAIDDLIAGAGWVSGNLRTVIPVTSAIVVPSNIKLEKVNIYVVDGAHCNGIENSDPIGGNEHVEISECKVDANRENQTESNNAIYLVKCDYSAVHDSIIRGGRRVGSDRGEGVEFDTSKHSRISHNFAYEAWYDDLKLRDCSYCKIDNNICWGASQQSGGIQVGSGQWNEVTDNVVRKTGTGEAGKGIKAHSDANVLIANNWVEAQRYGIDLIDASSFAQIIGNYVLGCEVGIIFRSSAARHVRIIGNYIYAYTGPRKGIHLEYGQDFVIRENTVTGYEAGQLLETGIEIDAGCTDIRVIDNEGLWLTTGIVNNGTGTVIKNNPLLESVAQGLYQSAAAFAEPAGTFDLGDVVTFEETTTGTIRLYIRDSAGWHFINQDG